MRLDRVLTFAVLFTVCGFLHTQEPAPVPVRTALPANARYEVITSSWLRRQIFLLDRYAGKVWQQVADGDGSVWDEMEVIQPYVISKDHPHFQISLSGQMAKDAFLIDNDSGNIWLLVKDAGKDKTGHPIDTFLWAPMTRYDLKKPIANP